MNKFKKFKNLFSLVFVVVIMFACCEKASAKITLKQLGDSISRSAGGFEYLVPKQVISDTNEKVYCMDRTKNLNLGQSCYESTDVLSSTESLAIGELINKVKDGSDDEYFAATMAINCYAGQNLYDESLGISGEKSRFCTNDIINFQCNNSICQLSQRYYNELMNYTDTYDANFTVTSPSNKKLTFTKDGNYYVATFELSSSTDVTINPSKGEYTKSGTTYTIKVPVSSVSVGDTIIVTATKSVNRNYAKKYTCGIFQPVAILESEPFRYNVSLSGTIPEGSIKLKKVDSKTSQELSGAQFELYDSANCEGNTVSGKSPFEINGTITINGLDLSKTYSVKEIKAPQGHVLPTDTCVVKSATPAMSNPSVMTIQNSEIPKGSIKLKKVDSKTKEELSGAKFELYDSANCEGNTVSGKSPFEINRTITIDGLDISKTYSVKEIKAPAGHKLPTDTCVVKSVTPKVDNPGVITIENFEISKVGVQKVDSITGKGLAGAKFHIENSEGRTVVSQWVSTTEMKWIDLDYGTYYLVEDEAPAGYIKDTTKKEFTLTASNPTAVVSMKNTPQPSLKILKVDDDGAPLAGAKLQLLAADKKTVVDEWVSTTAAHVISNGKVEAGKTYYLKEETAPAGYLLNENLIEVVLEKGETKQISFQNTKNSILIRKVDADDETKTVVGATLHIEDSNGKKIGESWVTDNNAHSIEKLEPGVYYVVEDKAPDGYIRNKSKVKFEVKGNENKVIEVKMTNEKSEIEISKQDATTGKELPGATLKLTDEKGEIVDEWVSTDKPYIIKGLKDGKYKLTETIAPEGYTLSTKTIEFEVKEGKVDKPVVMENELTPVPSTGGTRSTLLLFVAMLDIALGIGIINYVRKTRLQR